MNDNSVQRGQIADDWAGKRLDHVLADMFPDYSRSRLQQWLKEGQITVNGEFPRAKDKVAGGEEVELYPQLECDTDWQAQDIPLDIVHEDEHIMVIHKPAGLVVHPAVGNQDGTLLNGLLFHDAELATLPRAGIVHRLDKDTSGLLVVARTLKAQKSLVDQLQERAFLREYLAVVNGVLTAGGTVDEPMGRHPVHRKRMAVVPNGKPAITHYRIEQRYRAHSLLRVKLETGRTHQIRVHMAYINHPLVGDPVYGGRLKLPKGCSDEMAQSLRNFKRQALHATLLGLTHPASGEWLQWQRDVPEDMACLISVLDKDHEQADIEHY
jgi:23S rRNA pseudouridine1911/1915/1917 synthase